MSHSDEQIPAEQQTRSTSGKWWFAAIIVVVLGGGVYFYASREPAMAEKTPPSPGKGATQIAPVAVVASRNSDVGVYLTGLGNVTPLNTVSVKSRVDGQLMEIRFREGQNVSKGDLLAQLDSRPFQVQLTQAEGQIARDRELLNNARLDLQRYKQLWHQNSIPKQQLDTQEALVRQLEGTVKIDQGQVDSAKLQISYCRITAPISGRVGLRQVDPGNIVHAGDANGLVTITQLQPVAVIFPIPEDNLPKLIGKMKGGGRLKVDAYDREQKQKLASGTLLTMDNQIDPTTGTVKLKAVFPNSSNELFPNQFVNARLLLETLHDVVVVPAAAIQRGAQGTFVYLVKADSTVTVQPVTVGATQNDEIAVTAGLQAGVQVVVDGAERLRDGGKIEVKQAGVKKGPGSVKTPGSDKGSNKERKKASH